MYIRYLAEYSTQNERNTVLFCNTRAIQLLIIRERVLLVEVVLVLFSFCFFKDNNRNQSVDGWWVVLYQIYTRYLEVFDRIKHKNRGEDISFHTIL